MDEDDEINRDDEIETALENFDELLSLSLKRFSELKGILKD